MGDFYGVPGVRFIDHGEWSDPEVEYKGEVFNYYDLEEGLWLYYKEICEEEGIEPTSYGFEVWIDHNHDAVYGDLEDMIWNRNETKAERLGTSIKEFKEMQNRGIEFDFDDNNILSKYGEVYYICPRCKHIIEDDYKIYRENDNWGQCPHCGFDDLTYSAEVLCIDNFSMHKSEFFKTIGMPISSASIKSKVRSKPKPSAKAKKPITKKPIKSRASKPKATVKKSAKKTPAKKKPTAKKK